MSTDSLFQNEMEDKPEDDPHSHNFCGILPAEILQFSDSFPLVPVVRLSLDTEGVPLKFPLVLVGKYLCEMGIVQTIDTSHLVLNVIIPVLHRWARVIWGLALGNHGCPACCGSTFIFRDTAAHCGAHRQGVVAYPHVTMCNISEHGVRVR
jgi:hypothetical protein